MDKPWVHIPIAGCDDHVLSPNSTIFNCCGLEQLPISISPLELQPSPFSSQFIQTLFLLVTVWLYIFLYIHIISLYIYIYNIHTLSVSHKHVYIYMYTYMCIYNTYIHTYITLHTYIHNTQTHTHIYIYTCIYNYIYIYRICIYLHLLSQPSIPSAAHQSCCICISASWLASRVSITRRSNRAICASKSLLGDEATVSPWGLCEDGGFTLKNGQLNGENDSWWENDGTVW